jgi:hypothetical protein
MQPPTVAPERPRTHSLLVNLTLVGLIGFGFSFLYFQVVISQSIHPVLVVYAVGSSLIAISVARSWRWGPLLAAVWLGLIFIVSFRVIRADLANPAAVHTFVWQVVTTTLALVALAAGLGATIQEHRMRATR